MVRLLFFFASLLCVILPVFAVDNPPRSLVISNSASWIPYSFLDSEGQPKGLFIDLWQLFAEKNDVEITFELVDWDDSLELVREGRADVHGGLLMSETRAEFLDFSQDISRVRTLLFVRAESDVTDLSQMGDMAVGIVASTFEQEFVSTYFPNVVQEPYPNSEEVVRAAVDGDIQAFVSDYPSGYYHLIRMDSLDQFKSTYTLFTEGIRVAVKKDSDALLKFVDSGFARISKEDKKMIRRRWFVPEEPIPAWVWPTVIAGVVVIGLGLVGSHYLSLRRTVRRRTKALTDTVKKLETANVELDHLAYIDTLTGVANRHRFYESVGPEMERAKRYARPLSLVIFDLDQFKRINDRYGHLAGDATLRTVAEAFVSKLRENDVLARLGGDEFAAMLPDTDLENATHLAKRILEEVRDTSFEYHGQRIALTCSAGVAQYSHDETTDQWIQRADDELYRSKTVGPSATHQGSHNGEI